MQHVQADENSGEGVYNAGQAVRNGVVNAGEFVGKWSVSQDTLRCLARKDTKLTEVHSQKEPIDLRV